MNRLYGDSSGGNFFQSACTDGQVIEGINSDGTYSCVDPAEDLGVENLSETLTAGNVANQSINMDSHDIEQINRTLFNESIVIGDSSTKTRENNAIAIGYSTIANDTNTIGIGNNAEIIDSRGADNSIVIGSGEVDSTPSWGSYTTASSNVVIGRSSIGSSSSVAVGSRAESGLRSVGIGSQSEAHGTGSIAIGGSLYYSPTTASGSYSIALGPDTTASGTNSLAVLDGASATANGAIAFGQDSVAPNSYEATFGNLEGNEIDVNITGNTTIHGTGGINLASDQAEITNFFDQDQCGESEAVKTVYPNGSYECNPITTDQTTENLSETLTAGNIANQSIDMNGNNITNINTITGNSEPVKTENNIDMQDNNVSNAQEVETEKVDLGNGMSMRREGDDLVISD